MIENMASGCPYQERRAENPNNPGVTKQYEKGDRWRPYCISTQSWCTFTFPYKECIVFEKAGE